jgi:predicted metalloendopeptidase
MSINVARPKKYLDYTGVSFDDKSFVKNLLTINYFNFYHGRNGIDKITTERDNDIWPKSPLGSSFYSRLPNAVYISPKDLQLPKYSLDADPAIKYAVLGHVVGHEIGHGLKRIVDTECDPGGRNGKSLSEGDCDSFRNDFDRLSEKFSTYEDSNPFSVNVTAARSEIIADAYGLEAAYYAYRTSERTSFSITDTTGYFGDQRFFIAFAQGMRTDPRYEKNYISPKYPIKACRVNGSASSMGEEIDAAFYRENRSSHQDGLFSLPVVDFSGNEKLLCFIS